MSLATTGIEMRHRSRGLRDSVELVSSMRFSISLLTVICIAAMIGTVVKQGDWNRLHIVARGGTLTHIVNGQVMAIVIDEDDAARKASGVLALQIEQYGTGRVSFRNIWLKQ